MMARNDGTVVRIEDDGGSLATSIPLTVDPKSAIRGAGNANHALVAVLDPALGIQIHPLNARGEAKGDVLTAPTAGDGIGVAALDTDRFVLLTTTFNKAHEEIVSRTVITF